ncbi:hypothetical protein PHYBLDRAFT_163854 [Phycomyces blakesleeanus NRRL 1555(-)]|uniref:Uncharacterized protein n=1 Tax=Phycomyces blakesleeanus (strain ATCC 8743b / DSM 1359 / FGSC 10004 / NBRC 33097 / NRRL 1555) TaxID=763407 RepID=A0A162UY86_PHYB8|nr:hypothetical protein PHYBLDRAFT_163854 [Phycomyces blakesleeanus NRRL 1555(-)]OAD78762.1 hypothetical protein PHYBLDRAFT_163854 [Phycomyces blakesleeanus NRRL 1555(-)]|eukprot:XP_018296802.1 hypothetical protein PHYBLDRAFT_163854 [Phycomyces blakesleeanus NRRL 1555(-)]
MTLWNILTWIYSNSDFLNIYVPIKNSVIIPRLIKSVSGVQDSDKLSNPRTILKIDEVTFSKKSWVGAHVILQLVFESSEVSKGWELALVLQNIAKNMKNGDWTCQTHKLKQFSPSQGCRLFWMWTIGECCDSGLRSKYQNQTRISKDEKSEKVNVHNILGLEKYKRRQCFILLKKTGVVCSMMCYPI